MDIRDKNQSDLIIFLSFMLITSAGLLLRNFLNYSAGIRFLADSLGNIGGVIVAAFLFFWWVKESSLKGRTLIILYVGIGLIIYEFLQILIPWQTFDIKDILGTLIGVILALLINMMITVFRKLGLRNKK